MSKFSGNTGLKLRFSLVAIAVIIALGGAWFKLGALQLYKGRDLSKLSANQSLSEYETRSARGNVYDRNGHLFASSVSVDSIYAQPRKLSNPALTAEKLARATGITRKELQKKLQSDKAFVFIKRRVSPKMSAQIKALKLDNIGATPEEKRFYPNHAMLGQLLGLVSVDGVGVSSIEKAYNHILEGKLYKRRIAVDARGRHIDTADMSTAIKGGDLYLTIDQNIQFIAEENLKNAMLQYNAKAAWAVVMDVASGDLLAVANYPRLNPNAPGLSAQEAVRNNVFSQSYEPGSVFKMVTFAASLDAQIIKPTDMIDCENGAYKIGRFTIHDVSKKGVQTAAEVFAHSSNIGTMKIADKLGATKLQEALKRYGFGKTTGLALPEEAAGGIPRLPWAASRLANVSFGYGLTATALQMISFAATIANKGQKVLPRLVDKYTLDGTLVTTALTTQAEQVMSATAAAQLTEMMVSTTQPGAFAFRAHIAGTQVAGKSGTTEKLNALTKKYDKKRNTASFIGFAPAYNPKIAVMVVVDEPQGASLGGVVSAPVWREIVKDTLLYQGNLF